jgi:hypothetical protein
MPKTMSIIAPSPLAHGERSANAKRSAGEGAAEHARCLPSTIIAAAPPPHPVRFAALWEREHG